MHAIHPSRKHNGFEWDVTTSSLTVSSLIVKQAALACAKRHSLAENYGRKIKPCALPMLKCRLAPQVLLWNLNYPGLRRRRQRWHISPSAVSRELDPFRKLESLSGLITNIRL